MTLVSPQRVPVKAVDLGAGGIGVELPIELAPGTNVELAILSDHAVAYGTVRWVAPRENGFRIGIQFRTEDWNIIELILSLRSQEA